jgi:TonB family protein
MKHLCFVLAIALGLSGVRAGVVEGQGPEAVPQDPAKKSKIDQLPFPVGGVEALAKLIKYPQSARKDSIQGIVHVEATVDQEGRVVKAVAVKSVREDLDKAAIAAVTSVMFTPGMHEGKPVEAIVTIPIKFKLK